MAEAWPAKESREASEAWQASSICPSLPFSALLLLHPAWEGPPRSCSLQLSNCTRGHNGSIVATWPAPSHWKVRSMNFSVPLNLNLNNLFQHWWTLCRRESLDSLSRANLDLLACSLHLNQSQLCSAWSSQIIAGIGRVIRRLQSFQARERSVPARGRVPGTSAACLSTVRLLRGAWKDHEVPARVITRWRESRSGAEVQARAEQEREQWGKNPGHAS